MQRTKGRVTKEYRGSNSAGGKGLAKDDNYLMEINLEDMETTSKETKEYWPLAIQSAREARILRDSD